MATDYFNKGKVMMREVTRLMKSSRECAEAKKSNSFQDFFGYQKIYSDEVAREWLQEPKNLLLAELFVAERLARRGGKRKTMDAHGFEVNLFENLIRLRDALWSGEYKPSRGTVHVIFDPVQREIFAAPYVDRILHHWVVGTIMKWKDRRLIRDSYSCREEKGTLDGIKRLQHHILSVSRNMKKKAYVVQLDLSGYFMNIDKNVLGRIMKEELEAQFPPKTRDKRYTILKWAIDQVINDDPTDGVRLEGTYRDWEGLPVDKSLMMQPKHKGMVIGNYTSQTFSNIYLDDFDRFVVFTLGWKHYGRYVDDFYIVVTEDELDKVKRDIAAMEKFLMGYGLRINKKKTKVTEVHKGVNFLGATVRGFRIFPGRRIVQNYFKAAYLVAAGVKDQGVIVSYLGMLSHYDAGKIHKRVFDSVGWEYHYDKKKSRKK